MSIYKATEYILSISKCNQIDFYHFHFDVVRVVLINRNRTDYTILCDKFGFFFFNLFRCHEEIT